MSGFFLPGDTQRFDANSANFAVLARPFFSLNRNEEFAQLTVFPGISTGNIDVQNSSNLYGVEANLRCCLCSGCVPCDDCDRVFAGWNYHLDGLVGFRYLNLNEDLSITENVMNLPTAPMNPNVNAIVFDDFSTRNQFYGAQVGLDGEFGRGPWSLDVLGKLALGDTNQRININGGQQVTNLATGVTTPFVGGLLALPSNIGSHNHNAFSVVPEIDLTLSYHLNEHVARLRRLRLPVLDQRGASGRTDRPGAGRDADPELRRAGNDRPGRPEPARGAVPAIRLLGAGHESGAGVPVLRIRPITCSSFRRDPKGSA